MRVGSLVRINPRLLKGSLPTYRPQDQEYIEALRSRRGLVTKVEEHSEGLRCTVGWFTGDTSSYWSGFDLEEITENKET